jgi:hypothetical protein
MNAGGDEVGPAAQSETLRFCLRRAPQASRSMVRMDESFKYFLPQLSHNVPEGPADVNRSR